MRSTRRLESRSMALAIRLVRAVAVAVAVTLVVGGTGTAVAQPDPGSPGSDIVIGQAIWAAPDSVQTDDAAPTEDPAAGDAVDEDTPPTKAERKAAKKAAKQAARKAALKEARTHARAAANKAKTAAKKARTAGRSAVNSGARVSMASGQASLDAANTAKTRIATIRGLIQDGATVKKLDKAAARARTAAKTAGAAAKAAKKWPRKIANRLGKCSSQARACIDLTTDMAWLQSGGKIVYGPVPITAGRQGHVTRTGMWSVYYKNKDHVSREFAGAPMPYSVFFDQIGIAFHVGSLSVTSHGCIHLSWAAGVKFFDFLRYGDAVHVFGKSPYAPGQIYV